MSERAASLTQRPEFRRFLLGSLTGHAVLFSMLLAAPGLERAMRPPAPVYVDLITVAPAAKPKPAPRQKLDQPVVLKAKPKSKPQAAPKEVLAPKEKPKEILSAAEILSRLREQVGDEPETTTRTAAPGRFDPQMAAYQRRVHVVLRSNWAGFRGENLVARFEVEVDGEGRVRSLRATTSSGNRYFDESAERAIRLSDPLPRPPRGPVTLDVGFSPTGVF